MDDDLSGPVTDLLDRPLVLPCKATLPNRMVKASLSEGLASRANNPDERLFRLYRAWSEGGCGTLFSGNVMVHRRHLDKPGNVVIDGHEDRAALAAWAKAGTVAGNEFWMQINHTGRQTGRWCNAEPMAPSAVPLELGDYFGSPREMTEDEIVETVEALGRAAAVARDTGFSGVQMHAAHGYLASQFLSPRSNRRSDAWGGSLQNRARFTLEAVRAIRRAVGPDFPVGIKLNSADFQLGGFTPEECLTVVRWLNAESIDLLEVSGGTYETMSMAGADQAERQPMKESTRLREAYFLEYAAVIRQTAAMPLMVTGGFRSRVGMEAALREGATDAIGLGRPLCPEPDVVKRLLTGATDRVGSYEPRLAGELASLAPRGAGEKPRFESGLFWYNFQMQAIGRGEAADPDASLATARAGAAAHDDAWLAAWLGDGAQP